MRPTYRLLTRSDFDGLVCAALLREIGLIQDVQFIHPQDMLNGAVTVMEDDVLANVPYNPVCHLAFDRHVSELMRLDPKPKFIIDSHAHSTARVIFIHYGGDLRFPNLPPGLMEAVDRADPARYSLGEILRPTGWPLLHVITDPRTGLGRLHAFRVSNLQLMHDLIDPLRSLPVEEILALPDVAERVAVFRADQDAFGRQLEKCSRVDRDVAVVDYRAETEVHAGSRYAVYARHPEADAAIHILPTPRNHGVLIALTISPLHPMPSVNAALIMRRFGGGGHEAAATCQVAGDNADDAVAAVIDAVVAARG